MIANDLPYFLSCRVYLWQMEMAPLKVRMAKKNHHCLLQTNRVFIGPPIGAKACDLRRVPSDAPTLRTTDHWALKSYKNSWMQLPCKSDFGVQLNVSGPAEIASPLSLSHSLHPRSRAPKWRRETFKDGIKGQTLAVIGLSNSPPRCLTLKFMPWSLHCGYFPGCPLPHCLHLSTAVVISGSIRWPQGSAQSQRCPRGSSAPALAGFCPWPCFQCLFSLPPVFAGSWSSLFLPHRLCNWDTFTHNQNNNNNNNNNSPPTGRHAVL